MPTIFMLPPLLLPRFDAAASIRATPMLITLAREGWLIQCHMFRHCDAFFAAIMPPLLFDVDAAADAIADDYALLFIATLRFSPPLMIAASPMLPPLPLDASS